ncbi:unnamed protein product, partial [Prunus brigantina]
TSYDWVSGLYRVVKRSGDVLFGCPYSHSFISQSILHKSFSFLPLFNCNEYSLKK